MTKATQIIKKIEEENQPLVSILTPVYNTGQYLKEYVKSLEEGSYKNWELVLSDDGSTDKETLNILKELESNKKVRILYNKHQGAPAARNKAAAVAGGKYYTFLPSDSRVNLDAIKRWVGILEEKPDVDFVYCGYTFTDWDDHSQDIPYIPQEFDPYFLYQYNYIDGSALMKQEIFWNIGQWDENIISLQDWEFWIRAVKKGYKGYCIPESMFTTAHIRKDGLSQDSADNWLKRVDTIKRLHNLPDNKLCVSSLGAPFHGMKIAKILNADFQQIPARKPNKYKCVYSLGFFLGQNPDLQATVLGSFKGRKMIHWIGSDILQLMNAPYLQGLQLVESLNEFVDVHLVEFEQTKKELEELGIKNIKIVPLPLSKKYDIKSLPKEFSVAVYMPGVNQGLYCEELMISVARAMPDVKFKFFGNALRKGTLENIEYMGYVQDMEKFIEETSMIMRITGHDGLPLSPCEFAAMGRNVLSNIKMPFWEYVKPNKKQIIQKIREMQKMPVNKIASEYYNKLLDKEKYVKTIKKLAKI